MVRHEQQHDLRLAKLPDVPPHAVVLLDPDDPSMVLDAPEDEHGAVPTTTSWLDALLASDLAGLDEFHREMVADELRFRARRIADLETLTFFAAMIITSPARGAAAGPAEPGLADVVADRVVARLGGMAPAACGPAQVQRGQVTEASILDDVVLVERVARRLRRFVQAIVNRTVTVEPAALLPAIDDVTRAKARRALERSGFVKVR